jgi:hypothetical protein
VGMRKSWSRLITVNDVRFRYHVAERRDYMSGLHICIQQVEPAGQRLLTGFRHEIPLDERGNRQLSDTIVPHAVTPKVIRQLILAALEQGWQPAQTRLAPFRIVGSSVVPELPAPTKTQA